MATTITIFIVLFDSEMLRSSPQLAESVFIGKARTQDGGRTSAKKIKNTSHEWVSGKNRKSELAHNPQNRAEWYHEIYEI